MLYILAYKITVQDNMPTVTTVVNYSRKLFVEQAIAVCATTLTIMTLNIMGLIATLNITADFGNTWHNVRLSLKFFYLNAECHYAECHMLSVVAPLLPPQPSTLSQPMVKGSILAPIVRILSFCGIWQTLSVGLVQIFLSANKRSSLLVKNCTLH